MNDYEFRYILEQLKRQEEETERLEKKIDHLTNDMETMARSVKDLTKKLAEAPGAQAPPRKKREAAQIKR